MILFKKVFFLSALAFIFSVFGQQQVIENVKDFDIKSIGSIRNQDNVVVGYYSFCRIDRPGWKDLKNKLYILEVRDTVLGSMASIEIVKKKEVQLLEVTCNNSSFAFLFVGQSGKSMSDKVEFEIVTYDMKLKALQSYVFEPDEQTKVMYMYQPLAFLQKETMYPIENGYLLVLPDVKDGRKKNLRCVNQDLSTRWESNLTVEEFMSYNFLGDCKGVYYISFMRYEYADSKKKTLIPFPNIKAIDLSTGVVQYQSELSDTQHSYWSPKVKINEDNTLLLTGSIYSKKTPATVGLFEYSIDRDGKILKDRERFEKDFIINSNSNDTTLMGAIRTGSIQLFFKSKQHIRYYGSDVLLKKEAYDLRIFAIDSTNKLLGVKTFERKGKLKDMGLPNAFGMNNAAISYLNRYQYTTLERKDGNEFLVSFENYNNPKSLKEKNYSVVVMGDRQKFSDIAFGKDGVDNYIELVGYSKFLEIQYDSKANTVTLTIRTIGF